MSSTTLYYLILNGLTVGLIYMLIALGLTLIFGIMDTLNFAHGEVYMLGAFSTYYFSYVYGFNYFIAVLFSIVLIGLFGIVIDRLLLKPVKRELLPSAIVTLGLLMLLQSSALICFGADEKAIPFPISGIITFMGVRISATRLMVSLVCIGLVIALLLFIKFTRAGQSMLAVAQDREIAVSLGINTDRTSSLCMAIGCALAAAAGSLMGPLLSVHPYMGMSPLLKSFIIVVLGGLGSIPGTVIAALILGFVDSFVTFFYDASMASILGFATVILILLVRPAGLMGNVQK